ncbi:hypothetical protein ILYODFUR_026453 [Ilyodon furcidens]|uniref:Uncharacterized protein n=1 Tax=Ilyodon furcidens TaxID=33524 RepID=A0ABV0U8M8_9TELE
MLEADPTYPEPNPIISINHNLIPLRETNLPCLSEDYLYKGKIWFLKTAGDRHQLPCEDDLLSACTEKRWRA